MSSTRVVAEGRLSYPHLFEARAVNETSPKKFSVTLVIPKSDKATIEALKAAEAAAFQAGVAGPFKGKTPKVWGSALKDADEQTNRQGEILSEVNPAYKGCYILNTSTSEKFRPSIVDADFNDVIDPTVVYPGVGAKVAVNFFAYSANGNLGVAAGLNAVLITDTTLDSFTSSNDVRSLFGAPAKSDVALD